MDEIKTIFQSDKRVILMPVQNIMPDPDSPWKIGRDSQDYKELLDSITELGIIDPILVRKWNDKYQIIHGARRYTIALELGILSVPVIIVEPKNEYEMQLIRNDANLKNRRTILPSEKARAFKKELDALNIQGQRSDLEPVSEDGVIVDTAVNNGLILAQKYEMGRSQYYRYIKLNDLPEEIVECIDEEKISVRTGADYIVKLNKNNMKLLAAYCKANKARFTQKMVQNMIKAQELYGDLNAQLLIEIIEGKEKTVRSQLPSIKLNTEFIKENIPQHLLTEDVQIQYIVQAIKFYKKHTENQ